MSRVYIVQREWSQSYEGVLADKTYAFRNREDAEQFCERNSIKKDEVGNYWIVDKVGSSETMWIYELEIHESDDVEFKSIMEWE